MMDWQIKGRCLKSCIVPIMAVLCLGFAGCRSSNVIFATNTSIGLDVSGTSTMVPNHVSLAYGREETIFVPKGTSAEASILGTLDSEMTWLNGVAIGETFATGQAAIALTEELPVKARGLEPMLVLTGTRFGLNLDFGQTNMNAASLLVGYRRFNLAVVPPRPDFDEIQPVYGDITIHGSGLAGKFTPTSPRFEERQLSGNSGVRIVQTIATGRAAVEFVHNNRDVVSEKLTPAGQLKEHTLKHQLIAVILAQYDKLSSEGKSRFVAELCKIDKVESADTGTSPIRERLFNLTDAQRDKVASVANELASEEKST
jgi:hypothetical protein